MGTPIRIVQHGIDGALPSAAIVGFHLNAEYLTDHLKGDLLVRTFLDHQLSIPALLSAIPPHDVPISVANHLDYLPAAIVRNGWLTRGGDLHYSDRSHAAEEGSVVNLTAPVCRDREHPLPVQVGNGSERDELPDLDLPDDTPCDNGACWT